MSKNRIYTTMLRLHVFSIVSIKTPRTLHREDADTCTLYITYSRVLFFFFKFYSHNCYFYITIQTIQIHIAATNYMSMFYLFFGIEKSFVRKKILLGVEQNSIDMYVGKKHF